jgi:phosphoribosylglycinamide formyltransferase-1
MTRIMPLKLGVLASGRGSNFEALQNGIEAGEVPAVIKIVIADMPQAPVLEKASSRGIKNRYINPGQFADRKAYEQELTRVCVEYGVELVVLAGYMRILGDTFIKEFPLRIINIHPALLPSFSGLHAHRQALEYGVRFSGCTVHFVDLGVDTGPIILQQAVPVLPKDDEDSLAERILREEHILLPQAVKLIALGRVVVEGRRVTILEEEAN